MEEQIMKTADDCVSGVMFAKYFLNSENVML
jgi:hypothetical protein